MKKLTEEQSQVAQKVIEIFKNNPSIDSIRSTAKSDTILLIEVHILNKGVTDFKELNALTALNTQFFVFFDNAIKKLVVKIYKEDKPS